MTRERRIEATGLSHGSYALGVVRRPVETVAPDVVTYGHARTFRNCDLTDAEVVDTIFRSSRIWVVGAYGSSGLALLTATRSRTWFEPGSVVVSERRRGGIRPA